MNKILFRNFSKLQLLIYPVIMLFFSECLSLSDCRNRIKNEFSNPAKTYKAVKFGRDCGATTRSAVDLSILPFNESLPDSAGNIFIAYLDTVEISWLGNTELLIRRPKDMEEFRSDTCFNGFTIRYEDLVLKDIFDSAKRTNMEASAITKVELLMGDWQTKDNQFAFQQASKLVVSDSIDIKEIGTAVQAAQVSRGPETVHTHWIYLALKTRSGEEPILLRRSKRGEYHFNYKSDWYEGDSLAKWISDYLDRHPPLKRVQ